MPCLLLQNSGGFSYSVIWVPALLGYEICFSVSCPFPIRGEGDMYAHILWTVLRLGWALFECSLPSQQPLEMVPSCVPASHIETGSTIKLATEASLQN